MSMKYFWRDLEIFPLTNVALCFCNDPPPLGHVRLSSVSELLIGQLMVSQGSDWSILEFLSPLLSNHPILDFKRPQCRVNEQKKWKRCEPGPIRGQILHSQWGGNTREQLISISDKMLTPAKILKLFSPDKVVKSNIMGATSNPDNTP